MFRPQPIYNQAPHACEISHLPLPPYTTYTPPTHTHKQNAFIANW